MNKINECEAARNVGYAYVPWQRMERCTRRTRRYVWARYFRS